MSAQLHWVENRDRQVRDWLLLLLRFAITRDPNDRAALSANAAALDARTGRDPSTFSFFARTSDQICDAIVRTRDDSAKAILSKHVARIDDIRLRAAFLACLGLEEPASPQKHRARAAWRDRQDLWKGLPKR